MNIQGRFPVGLTDLISLLSKALWSLLFQHHSSKASILRHWVFFMVQLCFIFLVSKITMDGDCSHEVKRHLAPWKESYDKLSILKKRNITLLTKFHIVKAMVFPVTCGCEEWCVSQSCPTLCDPMDYTLPDSSVPVIFQVRILEWVATSPSRGSSWPRDWTCVSYVSRTGRWVLHH